QECWASCNRCHGIYALVVAIPTTCPSRSASASCSRRPYFATATLATPSIKNIGKLKYSQNGSRVLYGCSPPFSCLFCPLPSSAGTCEIYVYTHTIPEQPTV
ncbi:unnamed protein product, partial [Sphacelaria rigidula]